MVANYHTIYGGNAPGSNDAAMTEPSNGVSNTVNRGVNWLTEQAGYDSTRVNKANDNPFYRNNAQYMPGWGNTFGINALDPHGLPSGATAQDRATNYVGQDDPTGIWAGVRHRLVENEGAAIDALPKDAKGNPTGHIGFTDVYRSHVNAYHDAQQDARDRGVPGAENAGNPFVDPLSFGLAMYGAPLMEHLGINAGPITGASIDFFNDPTDSVGAGWAKRAGLGLAEMGAGFAVAGPLGMLPGAFSLAWNTGTAVNAYAEQNHLFGDDAKGHGLGITDWASNQGHAAGSFMENLTGSETVGDIASGATTALATVGGGIYAGGAAVADAIGSGVSAVGDAVGGAVSSVLSW